MFKTKSFKRLSFIVAVIVVFTAFTGVLSAGAFYSGQWIGIGTVSSASSSDITSELQYSWATLTDSTSHGQKLRSLIFNPATSGLMPLVYNQYSGYGATTLNSAKNAESKYGYDVKAGVNASFFSMSTGCNIYGGVVISNGKITQGCNSNGRISELIFNSDGTSALVDSRVTYNITAPWSAPLENINMYPETTGTGLYYYDTSCGTNSDIRAAGVEIVFNKLNGTELTVGGTLVGEVCEIRSSVSSGGAIGFNQFTLYASNSSPYAATLRALTLGTQLKIRCEETVAESKTAMENCSSAVVNYGYVIVRNGQNVTDNDGLDYSFNHARAQRTAVGIKSDGTLVILTCEGRTSTYAGLTVYQLADALISLGCVTAVNLDGGGSTQMVTESGGALSYVQSSSRRVSNSLLVIARPAVSSSLRSALAQAISNAQDMLDCYYFADETAITAALAYANGVYNGTKSMPGDYTKAVMRVNEAVDALVITGYKPVILRFDSAVSLRASASDGGTWLATVPAGTTLTVTQRSGDFGYTKFGSQTGWLRVNNAVLVGPAAYNGAQFTCPDERQAGAAYTASWGAVPGASGYTYKVIQLAGAPDPGNSNESLGAETLAYVTSSRDLSVTIPASAMTDGKYLKIAVATEFPDRTVWNVKYVTGSLLPFTDVPTNHWAYNAVLHCYTRSYFGGTSPTTFEPDLSMTRGMLAVVIYRMAGSPAVSGTCPFNDVPSGAYYYNAIMWCYQNGIASGYGDGGYHPNDVIIREQAAVLLYRFAQSQGYDVSVSGPSQLTQFADYASISSYAIPAMEWAVQNGIINGTGAGLINPRGNALRSHLAMIIKNFDTVYNR